MYHPYRAVHIRIANPPLKNNLHKEISKKKNSNKHKKKNSINFDCTLIHNKDRKL